MKRCLKTMEWPRQQIPTPHSCQHLSPQPCLLYSEDPDSMLLGLQ